MLQPRAFKNPPKAGIQAWVSIGAPLRLPAGLGNRWPVTVLAVGPEWCAIEAADGRRWIVETVMLDYGWRFDVAGNGSKTPEDHPAVLAYLEERLKALRALRKVSETGSPFVSDVSMAKWILCRNNRPPPDAEDPEQRRDEERDDEKHVGPPPPEPRWQATDASWDADESPP